MVATQSKLSGGRSAGITSAATILEVFELRRSNARDANHLGRKIERDHMLRTLGQPPGKSSRAATNLQRIRAICRHVLHEKSMVMIVVRPALVVQQASRSKSFSIADIADITAGRKRCRQSD
jgi:hypothetical protein